MSRLEDTDEPTRHALTRTFAIALLTLIAVRYIGMQVLGVYDDAFITFRYAANLAAGNGFVYHAGDWVMGVTTPAFGLFAALVHLSGLPVPETMRIFNLLCDGLVLYIVFGILTREASALSFVLFGALFSLSPILTRISVGGMEANAFLLCSLGAIVLYRGGRKNLAVLVAAAAYFLRPEAVILVGIFCVLELLSAGFWRAFRLGTLAWLVVLPFLALLWLNYGQFLPQSVAAKWQSSGSGTIAALFAPGPLSPLLLPFAIWGAVRSTTRDSATRIIGIWAVLYAAAYLMAGRPIWSWYVAPIQFANVFFASLGGADLLGRLPLPLNRVSKPQLATVLGTTVILAWVGIWFVVGESGWTRYVQGGFREWAASTEDLEGKSILAGDIGIVGYYSNARIYDTAGLVWPEATALDSTAIIREFEPDYLFLTTTQTTAGLLRDPEVSSRYRPIARFSTTNDRDFLADPAEFEAQWTADYILFERRAEESDQR